MTPTDAPVTARWLRTASFFGQQPCTVRVAEGRLIITDAAGADLLDEPLESALLTENPATGWTMIDTPTARAALSFAHPWVVPLAGVGLLALFGLLRWLLGPPAVLLFLAVLVYRPWLRWRERRSPARVRLETAVPIERTR